MRPCRSWPIVSCRSHWRRWSPACACGRGAAACRGGKCPGHHRRSGQLLAHPVRAVVGVGHIHLAGAGAIVDGRDRVASAASSGASGRRRRPGHVSAARRRAIVPGGAGWIWQFLPVSASRCGHTVFGGNSARCERSPGQLDSYERSESRMGSSKPKVSVVCPAFEEEACLPHFHAELAAVLDSLKRDYDAEIIYVDDGSRDKTLEVVKSLARQDARVRLPVLQPQFRPAGGPDGGARIAGGDAVITMDSDLQHPPELIPQLLEKWRQGHDVVLTIRAEDKRLGVGKRLTSNLFYVAHAGSARPMCVRPGRIIASSAARSWPCWHGCRERQRFLRGLVQWLGFSVAEVPFHPDSRKAGASKPSFRSLLRLAGDGIFSFSAIPLRLAVLPGHRQLGPGSCVDAAHAWSMPVVRRVDGRHRLGTAGRNASHRRVRVALGGRARRVRRAHLRASQATAALRAEGPIAGVRRRAQIDHHRQCRLSSPDPACISRARNVNPGLPIQRRPWFNGSDTIPRRPCAWKRLSRRNRSRRKGRAPASFRLPDHVILENDDHHSFDFVMETLQKALGFDEQKAFLVTHKAHTTAGPSSGRGPRKSPS